MRFLKADFILLLLVLLSAVALRFFHFYQWHFSYDELSALTRLNYPDIKTLFQEGIIPDGHPPLVQIFLYFYTKLFGTHELVVKFPFVMCGIGSVYLAYQIGKKVAGEYCGLFTSAWLSVSQFFIYYSITARPYIVGLFFFLWFLLRLIERVSDARLNPNKGSFAIALLAVLSSLSHHLALMTCGISFLVFWFFFSKGRQGFFIRTLIYCVILYAPNLPIFWQQLMKGGIGSGLTEGGWLSAPDFSFFIRFFSYLFQYSYLQLGIVVVILLVAFYFKFQKSNIRNAYFIPLFTTFLICLAVPFFYSRWVNPLLQFSGLIFVAPLFFILIGINLKFLPKQLNYLFLIVAISIFSLALVKNRKWFDVAGRSVFHTTFQWNETFSTNQNENVLTVLGAHESFPGFYANRFNYSNRVHVFDDKPYLNPEIFFRMINDAKPNVVILGGIDPIFTELLIQNDYKIETQVNCYDGEVVKLYKGISIKNPSFFISETEKIHLNNSISSDSTGQFYQVDSNNVYDLNAEINLNEKLIENGSFLNFVLRHDKALSGDPLLCFSVQNGDSTLQWISKPCKDFTISESNNVSVLHAFLDKKTLSRADRVKVFLWNQNAGRLKVRGVGVFIRPGNPYRYGLTEDF